MFKYKYKSKLVFELPQAYALYQKGWTTEKLGRSYGVSRQYVQQLFRRKGYKLRHAGSQKFPYCRMGHLLGVGEYAGTCPKCNEKRKALRAKGLHLKKKCKYGHPLVEGNLLRTKKVKGNKIYIGRRCKTCAYAKIAEYARKKRNKGEN